MDTNLFSKTLFWDTETTLSDIDKYKFYIIERIITRGNYADWKTMVSLYTLKEIKSGVTKIKGLDPKTLNFCSLYSKIPKDAFECYTKPTLRQRCDF